jgi:hypothetical protein
MLRNNVIKDPNGPAINVGAYDATYNRIVSDLTINNNTAINTGTYGMFIELYGKAQGVALTNNLYIGTQLKYGLAATVNVYVKDTSLSSFSAINGNVWPVPASISWEAYGGEFYVNPNVDLAAGFMTPSVWNSQTVVGTDTVQRVSLTNLFGATINTKYVGSNLPFNG